MNGVQTSYVSNALYSPSGAIRQLDMGNGTQEIRTFNPRFQVTSSKVLKAGAELSSLTYDYGQATNNGNLLFQTIRVQGMSQALVQGFIYDDFNRLDRANESNDASWYQDYGYDQFGNRWMNSSSANLPTDGLRSNGVSWYRTNQGALNNNRMKDVAYDNSGNLQEIPGYTIVYDAENSPSVATNGSLEYTYDGQDRRVKSKVGNVTTTFVYDAFGNLAAEYSTVASGESGRQFLHTDPLGSTRLTTDSAGSVIQCFDYLPFGEQLTANRSSITCYNGTAGVRQRFTGKERDSETGLDYFGARYFSGAQGRFTSPDKLNVTDDRLMVPGALNKYTYAANNPLRFKDPDGRDVVALLEPPHGVRLGYFALFAHNPNTNQTAFMSFGPTDESFSGQLLTLSGGPVGSSVSFGMSKSADDLRRDYAALSIQTSPEQAQEVINFINGFGAAENPTNSFRRTARPSVGTHSRPLAFCPEITAA